MRVISVPTFRRAAHENDIPRAAGIRIGWVVILSAQLPGPAANLCTQPTFTMHTKRTTVMAGRVSLPSAQCLPLVGFFPSDYSQK